MINKSEMLNLLTGIYNTLQELEVKGERNCSYIFAMCNTIKQQIEEISKENAEEIK